MMNFKTIAFAAFLCACSALSAAVTLTGDTTEPKTSMYELGKQAELVYSVDGLKPGEELKLELNIVDEKDKMVKDITVPVKGDAQGKWNGNIKAPSERLGFYRVHSKLSNGVTLPKLGSRKAGYLTYAIVFGEKRYKEYPMDETFFGSHGPSFGFHRMIGLRWGYKGENMVILEKTPGAYSRNPEAGKVDLLKKVPEWKEYYQTNQNSLPKWMMNPKYRIEKDGKWVNFTEEGEKAYAEYLKVFAKNYVEQMKKNQPRAFIQVTWEPMFPWGFAGTPADLVRIHKNAYEAIHSVTSDAWVIGPTSAGLNSIDWHRELFEAGLLKYVDAIAIHPYHAFPPEQNGMVDTIRKFKALIREYAGRDLDIHGNEAGWATHELSERELTQMHGTVRANLIFLGEGFKSNMVFYTHDYWGEPGYGYTYNLNPKISFGTDKVAPKPLTPALGGAAYFLNGHTTAGAIEYLGETAWGYAYQRKDGFTTLALWDYSGNPLVVEIPVGRSEIEIGDMMGNTRKVKTEGGNLKLTLTEDPVYVIDVDPAIWGRGAVKTIAPDSTKLDGVAGKQVRISGKITAGKQDINGVLQLICDSKMNTKPRERKIFIKAGTCGAFEFTPVLPGVLTEGKYPLMLKLFVDGKCIAAAGQLLQVLAPVRINDVLPGFENGKKKLSINVSELTGSEVSGTLSARIVGNPDGRKRSPFRLAPNSTKELVCVYDDLDVNSLKYNDLELTIETSSGNRLKHTSKINFLDAAYRPAIKIDGDFADWKGIPSHPFDPSMILDETNIYKGRKDLDASISFAWNEKYLFFYVDVADDIFYQPYSGWQTWDGDSLQMGFTKAVHHKDTGNMYQDKMDLAYSEIDFALSPKGPDVYRTVTFDDKRFPIAQVSLQDAPLNVKKTVNADGSVRLQYEVAVPWSFLGIDRAPLAGQRIGWAMTVNDRDQKQGNRVNLQAFTLKKTDQFGIIVLTK